MADPNTLISPDYLGVPSPVGTPSTATLPSEGPLAPSAAPATIGGGGTAAGSASAQTTLGTPAGGTAPTAFPLAQGAAPGVASSEGVPIPQDLITAVGSLSPEKQSTFLQQLLSQGGKLAKLAEEIGKSITSDTGVSAAPSAAALDTTIHEAQQLQDPFGFGDFAEGVDVQGQFSPTEVAADANAVFGSAEGPSFLERIGGLPGAADALLGLADIGLDPSPAGVAKFGASNVGKIGPVLTKLFPDIFGTTAPAEVSLAEAGFPQAADIAATGLPAGASGIAADVLSTFANPGSLFMAPFALGGIIDALDPVKMDPKEQKLLQQGFENPAFQTLKLQLAKARSVPELEQALGLSADQLQTMLSTPNEFGQIDQRAALNKYIDSVLGVTPETGYTFNPSDVPISMGGSSEGAQFATSTLLDQVNALLALRNSGGVDYSRLTDDEKTRYTLSGGTDYTPIPVPFQYTPFSESTFGLGTG